MRGVNDAVRGLTIVLALSVLAASSVRADTTTERSSSIVIFPKVVFDDTRDTLIQISNTSNSMTHAHCFYVNAVPFCTGTGSCLDDTCTGLCLPQWQEVDFHIWLTKQQPTSWSAGFGRLAYPADGVCRTDFRFPERSVADCYGAGLDPGRIPPVSIPFQGELKCVQVDPSGAPISGNHLKGEATIVSRDGDSSKYNAIGVAGLDSNDGDNTLCLGGESGDRCPNGAEYNGCPDTLLINHFAAGADNPLFGPASTVDTELTLVPCAQNFETQNPASVVVQFRMTNEFEQDFSASTTVDCWGNFLLDEINPVFRVRALGSRMIQTRARPVPGASGVVGVIEEHHRANGATARAALNLHHEGERADTDLIVLPEGP